MGQHLHKKYKTSKYEAIRQDAHVEFLSDGDPVVDSNTTTTKDQLAKSAYNQEIQESYVPRNKYDVSTVVLFNKIRLSSNVSQYIPVVFALSCVAGILMGIWMCL